MYNINKDELKIAIDKTKLQGDSIERMIGKFFVDSTLSEQKNLELCQVGKFLTSFDSDNVEIIEQCESPDFIISVNGIKIGLEHELIMNKKNVKRIQSIKNLFKQAEKDFKEKYPDLKVLANCWLKTDNFTFRQMDKKIIINQIVDYIYGLTQNSFNEKPDFIDDIRIMKHSGVSFNFNTDISFIKSLDSLTLLNAIEKKEKLINKYIMNSGLQEQWLFIVIGQISPDSFEINEMNFKIDDSRFERIYLFEDFNAKKHRLK